MLLIKVTLPPLDKYKRFHPANLLSIFSRIGFVYFIPLLVDDIFEICLYGKGKDGRDDDIKFYVIKVPYAHREDSSSSSSSTMRKKKGEEKVEHLIPISVQKAQTCNHFAVLDGKLYFVANDLSLDAPVKTSENSLYREVWTFDLACAEEGWSRAFRLNATRIPLF